MILWIALGAAAVALFVVWIWLSLTTWYERDRGEIPLWRWLAGKARHEDP